VADGAFESDAVTGVTQRPKRQWKQPERTLLEGVVAHLTQVVQHEAAPRHQLREPRLLDQLAAEQVLEPQRRGPPAVAVVQHDRNDDRQR